ncbi:hypothetical protein V3C99_016768, partial [Haemonchus contortus]
KQMLLSWLVGVFNVISSPVVAAKAHVRKVDPLIENLTYSGIVIEKMEGFTGRSQAECIRYKAKCDEFMKCFGNCAEFLIRASDLNDVDEERLTDDQKKAAQNIQTNPCVGMFAYCLSVDYFKLAHVLQLTTPDAF